MIKYVKSEYNYIHRITQILVDEIQFIDYFNQKNKRKTQEKTQRRTRWKKKKI